MNLFKVTLLKHRCRLCGLRHKEVTYNVFDFSHYCTEGAVCLRRRHEQGAISLNEMHSAYRSGRFMWWR